MSSPFSLHLHHQTSYWHLTCSLKLHFAAYLITLYFGWNKGSRPLPPPQSCIPLSVDHANKNLDCFDKDRQMMQPQQQGTRAILRIISMAESASRQYGWLATRLSLKDVPILSFDIFRLGPPRKLYLFGHEINPLLILLVRSRWLDIGLLVPFCVVIIVFFDPWMRKQELDQYPAFLISRLVNNTY